MIPTEYKKKFDIAIYRMLFGVLPENYGDMDIEIETGRQIEYLKDLIGQAIAEHEAKGIKAKAIRKKGTDEFYYLGWDLKWTTINRPIPCGDTKQATVYYIGKVLKDEMKMTPKLTRYTPFDDIIGESDVPNTEYQPIPSDAELVNIVILVKEGGEG